MHDATVPILVGSVVDKGVFGIRVVMFTRDKNTSSTEKVDSTGVVRVGGVASKSVVAGIQNVDSIAAVRGANIFYCRIRCVPQKYSCMVIGEDQIFYGNIVAVYAVESPSIC